MMIISFQQCDAISAQFSDITRRIRSARRFAPLVSVFLAGCSIAPIQQEVTGIKTEHLMNYIRCETRLAIQDKALDLMRKEASPAPVIVTLEDRRSRGEAWPADARARMNANERAIYDKYIETGIAFDFTFDITEGNGAGGLADPVRLITNGSAGVGLAASGDYKRQNARRFVVSDTAQSLIQNERLRCPPHYRASNYAYPISGGLGIKELISTFFELNETKELGVVDKDRPTTVFVDTLTFTTTLIGSVSPHVIIAPVANAWGLASPTGVTVGASRIDKHQLIIGLSLDKPKGKTVAGAAILPSFSARSALQKASVTSFTEQSALDAVHQARIDAYLDRAVR